MKTKKLNNHISEGSQDEKPKSSGQQKTDQDPKQFEEDRSMSIRMKPQPYQGSAKKATPGKEKK